MEPCLVFFILVAYIATREYTAYADNDISRYTSTFNIKSTLLTQLTIWINDQSGSFDETSKSLGISPEKLEVIIKGRVDLLSVDDLIDLLIKTNHQVDVQVQTINSAE